MSTIYLQYFTQILRCTNLQEFCRRLDILFYLPGENKNDIKIIILIKIIIIDSQVYVMRKVCQLNRKQLYL